VNELLARGEKMALTDASGSPENRAAVLEMIADRYVSTDNGDRAQDLLARALQLVEKSPDAALRSRLTCKHAAATADLGDSERWLRTIHAEAARSGADPQTTALCLLKAAQIYLAEERSIETLRDAQLGLEKSRQSANGGGITEAALLSTIGYGYSLSSRVAEAERYYEQSIRKYRELGREQSDGALVVLNDWGISMHNAGVPRRALELLDESIRIEGQRGPDIELTATVLGNRGLALQALGRFQQARAAFDEECRLAISHSDEFTEMHCLLGEGSVAMMIGEFGDAPQLDTAQHYLDRFRRLLDQSGAPADSPPARAYLLVQSRVYLARGQLAKARARFERAIIERPHDSMNLDGYLGSSMTALAANDAARAVEFARRAMPIAVARQGDLPYSHYVGSASLWLGRALLRAGDRVEGRKALEAAVVHLSNTIDADHPNVLQARAELRDAQRPPAQTAHSEQSQQHAER
jgi:tetratricopeptide (TPR) repeat protein